MSEDEHALLCAAAAELPGTTGLQTAGAAARAAMIAESTGGDSDGIGRSVGSRHSSNSSDGSTAAPADVQPQMGREVGAAMVAATAVPLLLNWCDVVKTRMQGVPAVGCTAPPYSRGFASTAWRILHEEGALALWGKAMPAALARECTVIGTRIGACECVACE